MELHLREIPLTFREYAMGEVPADKLFRAIFDFMRQRKELVLFGAHAVNVYVQLKKQSIREGSLHIYDTGQSGNYVRAVIREDFVPMKGLYRVPDLSNLRPGSTNGVMLQEHACTQCEFCIVHNVFSLEQWAE